MTASARRRDSATISEFEPGSSANPCSLINHRRFFFSQDNLPIQRHLRRLIQSCRAAGKIGSPTDIENEIFFTAFGEIGKSGRRSVGDIGRCPFQDSRMCNRATTMVSSTATVIVHTLLVLFIAVSPSRKQCEPIIPDRRYEAAPERQSR